MGRPPCTRWCTGDIVVRVNRQNPSGLADARPPPLMGRLSRGRSPRKKAPHQGSWPSLRGLRGSARYHLLQKLLACCKLRRHSRARQNAGRPVGGFALFPAADRAGRCCQPAAKKRSRLLCRDRRRVVHHPHLRPPPDGARKLHAGARNRPAKNRVGGRLAAPGQRHAPPGVGHSCAESGRGCPAASRPQRARDLCAGQGPAPHL